MHKFHSLNVVTCFPPMSEVFFSTDLCRHHTFCGGVSRVVRAMAEKTPEKTRSRSQETPEESTGRVIVDTMLSAARSLEACVGKLDTRLFWRMSNRTVNHSSRWWLE